MKTKILIISAATSIWLASPKLLASQSAQLRDPSELFERAFKEAEEQQKKYQDALAAVRKKEGTCNSLAELKDKVGEQTFELLVNTKPNVRLFYQEFCKAKSEPIRVGLENAILSNIFPSSSL